MALFHPFFFVVPLDSLLRLNAEKASEVQEKITSLCEEWFTQELTEKERVAPQTISFLLLQALRDDAKVAGNPFFFFLLSTFLSLLSLMVFVLVLVFAFVVVLFP